MLTEAIVSLLVEPRQPEDTPARSLAVMVMHPGCPTEDMGGVSTSSIGGKRKREWGSQVDFRGAVEHDHDLHISFQPSIHFNDIETGLHAHCVASITCRPMWSCETEIGIVLFGFGGSERSGGRTKLKKMTLK